MTDTMDDMSRSAQHERPRNWKAIFVTSVALAVALPLAAYSAAASYESLSGLAAAHGIPLAQLYPAGLDGGLFGVIVISVALTWAGHPLGWLRMTGRVFAAGTIAANAAAGWPDVIAASLRVAAPFLFVVIAEVGYAVLLRRYRGTLDSHPVPVSRWLLAFPSTFRLWRRMKLWGITSYPAAVDMELSRLHAMQRLRDKYGEGWRGKVPGALAWMLDGGLRMGEALALVEKLTAPAPAASPASPGSPARSATTRKKSRSRPGARRRDRDDLDTRAEALSIIASEPGISGSELGRRLGVDPSYGRTLRRQFSSPAPDTGEIPAIREA